MKRSLSHPRAAIAALLFLAATSPTLVAQGINRGGHVPALAAEQSGRTVPKGPAMKSCPSCRTVAVTPPKGILAWFTPQTRHDCPGCRVTTRFTGSPGRSTNVPTLTHSCSICGNAAATVCAHH